MSVESDPTNSPRAGKRVEGDVIFETLRDRICLRDYPPGTVLREAELAAEFGVSRTPIRAVLQRLVFGGLIVSRDGVGNIVTTVAFDELRDIYRMRLKIAELIGEMTPRPCEAVHLATIDALIARADALTGRFEMVEYWRINHEQHFLIAELIGNSALREMWDQLYFQVARIWYGLAREAPAEVARSLCAELRETAQAMREGDMIAVGYIQRNYIAYGLRRVENHFTDAAVD